MSKSKNILITSDLQTETTILLEAEVGKQRTRWKRWLGNKTRKDKDYWVTLLDSNWMGWATKLTGKSLRINEASREKTKEIFTEAMEEATSKDFIKLDDIYVQDKYNL